MAETLGGAVEGREGGDRREGGRGGPRHPAVSRGGEALHLVHVSLPLWSATHGACPGLHHI